MLQNVVLEDEDEAGPVGDEDDEEDEEGSDGEDDEVGLSYLMKEGIQVSPWCRARECSTILTALLSG